MIALMLKALKYVSESILTDSDDKKSVIGIGYKKNSNQSILSL